MKLNTIFALICTILISSSIVGQIDESKSALLELESQLYHKKFTKKWDKLKKVQWEEKCNAAESIEELNVLFNEYSDLMAQLISFSMGNSDATNELEFAEYLLKVNGVLPENLLSNFDVKEREIWILKLKEIVHTEKYKLEKEEQLKKFLMLSKKLSHFKKYATEIIEYSKKTAFNELEMNNDFLNNGQASECSYRFEKGASGKQVCTMNYATGGDPLMAKKLVLEFKEALEKSIYPNHKSDVVITTLSDSDYSVEVTIVDSISTK